MSGCKLVYDTALGPAAYISGSLLDGDPQYELAGQVMRHAAVLALIAAYRPRGRQVPFQPRFRPGWPGPLLPGPAPRRSWYRPPPAQRWPAAAAARRTHVARAGPTKWAQPPPIACHKSKGAVYDGTDF